MPRTDIANYLRLAPETVSRLFRRFQDDSLIRVRGRDLEVCDRHGLEALAAATRD
jgi:CRP/FNR family transcriptional regulator